MLNDCRFSSKPLYNPNVGLDANMDAYLAWRRSSEDKDFAMPAHWSHLSKEQVLRFLDRHSGVKARPRSMSSTPEKQPRKVEWVQE
jgi:hypothetical protein